MSQKTGTVRIVNGLTRKPIRDVLTVGITFDTRDDFVDGRFVTMTEFGGKFTLPTPETLISMKLKSVPGRTKDDKRIKDISDIYALAWYSVVEFQELRLRVQKILGIKYITETTSSFTKDDYLAASRAIGIEPDEISRVINEIAKQ